MNPEHTGQRDIQLQRLQAMESKLFDGMINALLFIIRASALQREITQLKRELGVAPDLEYPDMLADRAGCILRWINERRMRLN
jgi:hypothetical protein